MDLSQINVLHIIGAVVVLDLAACPVDALDFNDLTVLDGSTEGHWIMGSIEETKLVGRDAYRLDATGSAAALAGWGLLCKSLAYMKTRLLCCRLVEVDLYGRADL